MLRLSFYAMVLFAAFAQTAAACQNGCISTIVEWEEGYGPCDQGCISTVVEWEDGYGPTTR